MPRHTWIGVAIVFAAVAWGPAAERVWVSNDGRSMRAEFVRELDGEVTFLKDGKIITLPLERLSARDQQVVRDLAAGKPVPVDSVPAAPADSPTPVAPSSEPVAAQPPELAPRDSSPPPPLVKKPLAIENRTWTDVFGNQLTGKYVRIFGSNVVLLRGGKSVTVKFYELSSEDQEYLRELLTSRGQEGLIPPKINPNASNSGQGAPDNAPPDNGSLPHSGGPAGGSIPPAGGVSFPGSSGPSFPGGSPFSGPAGASFPPAGSVSPPTVPESYAPPAPSYQPPSAEYAPSDPVASGFPSSSPPGMPGSAPGPNSSPLDRFHQQMEQSRQQQLDSIQRMQDRMNQRHESLFNRHGSTGECLNCKHNLNDAEMRRSSCPYCGVTWDYEIDEYGNKRQLNNSSIPSPFAGGAVPASSPTVDPRSARMIGLAIGVFIGLVVVAGMVIGTIYIIMSIASASSSSQQRHYR